MRVNLYVNIINKSAAMLVFEDHLSVSQNTTGRLLRDGVFFPILSA